MSLIQLVAHQLVDHDDVALSAARAGGNCAVQARLGLKHALVGLGSGVVDGETVADVVLGDELVERQRDPADLVRAVGRLVVHDQEDERLALELAGHDGVHEDVEVEVAVPLGRGRGHRVGPALVENVEAEGDQRLDRGGRKQRVRDVAALQDVDDQVLLLEHVGFGLLQLELLLKPVLGEAQRVVQPHADAHVRQRELQLVVLKFDHGLHLEVGLVRVHQQLAQRYHLRARLDAVLAAQGLQLQGRLVGLELLDGELVDFEAESAEGVEVGFVAGDDIAGHCFFVYEFESDDEM